MKTHIVSPILVLLLLLAADLPVRGQMIEATSTGVGIGTSSPGSYKLNANGAVGIADGSPLSLRSSLSVGSSSLQYAIHYSSVGPHYPIRFVGASDGSSQRYFEFGYYTADNPTSGWNPGVVINSYSGFVGLGAADPANFGRLTVTQTGTGFGSHGLVVTNGATSEGVALSDSGASAYKMLQSYGGVLALNPQGNYVGVGTTTPGYLLTVNGPVRASQFIADVGTYSDFVFKAGYRLAPLPEVAASIARDGHLPDIPGEAEAIQRGLDVMAMQVKLLQKIEELTLYAIEQNRRLDAQATAIQELRQENVALRATASGPR